MVVLSSLGPTFVLAVPFTMTVAVVGGCAEGKTEAVAGDGHAGNCNSRE